MAVPIPVLPTDNVWKFLTVVGLIVAIAAGIAPIVYQHQIVQHTAPLGGHIKVLAQHLQEHQVTTAEMDQMLQETGEAELRLAFLGNVLSPAAFGASVLEGLVAGVSLSKWIMYQHREDGARTKPGSTES